MAITPLPAVPLRSDEPATFVTKADAFLGALNLFATEVDAVGVALTLGATNATSTTSLLIGLGSKSLTVQTGKSYVVGMTVKIASTATGVNWMLGDITSYTTGTGALVVTVVGISGSGTFAAWSISQSATGGAKLGANADITSLSGLTTPLSVAQGGTGLSTALPAYVLQGTGVSQLTNTVKIGWDGAKIRGTIDATDIGQFAMMGDFLGSTAQTWQTVSASRAANVTYTNTTGRPIYVAIDTKVAGGASALVVNGIYASYVTGGVYMFNNHCGVVPIGGTYSVTILTTGYIWTELR